MWSFFNLSAEQRDKLAIWWRSLLTTFVIILSSHHFQQHYIIIKIIMEINAYNFIAFLAA